MVIEDTSESILLETTLISALFLLPGISFGSSITIKVIFHCFLNVNLFAIIIIFIARFNLFLFVHSIEIFDLLGFLLQLLLLFFTQLLSSTVII
jgi:hypothetical protein